MIVISAYRKVINRLLIFCGESPLRHFFCVILLIIPTVVIFRIFSYSELSVWWYYVTSTVAAPIIISLVVNFLKVDSK